uniref:transmembrane protein 11, mitochondrial n=1 Tax=Myxine glutinosa TaxID=7769 RepID=UPI00358F08E9
MAAAGPGEECIIIHEVYEGDAANERFELELERALEAQYRYIVVEPARIGDETARWIAVGNCLHKSAVLAGASCLLIPFLVPSRYVCGLSLPLGVVSAACAALYAVSWQYDPCCKYQVEGDAEVLARLPLHTLRAPAPVVLCRRDDTLRKRLHNTLAIAAALYCLRKAYEMYAP